MIENLHEDSSPAPARRLLGELSAAFAEAGRSDQELLDLIARRTAEAVPEVCTIRLLSRDGKRLKLASIYGSNPQAVTLIKKVVAGLSPQIEDQPQAAEAIRTGTTFVSEILPPGYTESLIRPELWPFAERFGPKWTIVVPMRVRGRTIGVLTVGRFQADQPPFSAEERALLEDVTSHAALVVENARLHRLLTTKKTTLETLVAEKTSELEEALWRLDEITRQQRVTLDRANYAILSTRLDGTIVSFNAAAERWLGYRAEEVVEKLPATFLHDPKELLERSHELSRELGEPVAPGFDVLVGRARRGQSEMREWTYVSKDGVRFPVRLAVSPVRSRGGRISGFVCTASDSRSYRQAEDALRAERERTRSILEAAGEGILAIDLRDQTLFLNPAATAMLGWTGDELQLHNAHDLLHHSHPDGSPLPLTESPIYLTCTQGESHQVAGDVFWSRDGRPVPVDYTSTPILDQGETVGAVVVFRDVTESQRAEAALREAQAAAERANSAKSEFLSRVSHELRTPLNAIIGFSQLLTRRELTDSQREYVGYIEQSGNHLLALINEVLDISRVEAGGMSLSLETVDLREVVEDVVTLIAPQADKRQLLVVQTVASNGWVSTDRQRLKQVLLNLCSNAVKFNREEGQVHVWTERLATGRFRIGVRDTGPGIPLEDQSRLFAPFERLSADRRGTEGTGLGLALSKHLVELMQGMIGFESVEGQGSTFWIEIPSAEPPVPGAPLLQ